MRHPASPPCQSDQLPVPDPATCKHGLTFDPKEAEGVNNRMEKKAQADGEAWRSGNFYFDIATRIIRSRWPRLFGACPFGCGFEGIAYASRAHLEWGDW